MGTTALASVRSCGVTTLAVALAATWPAGRRVLVVEADQAGGTLAGAAGWPPEPSLVSLAAAARRGGDPALVWEHCHQLPGGAMVLAGPSSPEQAGTALGMLGPLLGRLGEFDAEVLVDCGRLAPGPSMFGVLRCADRRVVAARPRLADLHALSTWLETCRPEPSPQLVMVGDGPYSDAEITDALGVEVVARLPWDPDAAASLLSVPASARALRMAPLVRAARSLADRLAGSTAERAEPGQVSAEPAGGRFPVAVPRRLLRARRPGTAPVSSNGNAAEEATT
ncbi:MAG: hypothetical protein ACRDYB_03670 [Acidimicrobiales bacterium]